MTKGKLSVFATDERYVNEHDDRSAGELSIRFLSIKKEKSSLI